VTGSIHCVTQPIDPMTLLLTMVRHKSLNPRCWQLLGGQNMVQHGKMIWKEVLRLRLTDLTEGELLDGEMLLETTGETNKLGIFTMQLTQTFIYRQMPLLTATDAYRLNTRRQTSPQCDTCFGRTKEKQSVSVKMHPFNLRYKYYQKLNRILEKCVQQTSRWTKRRQFGHREQSRREQLICCVVKRRLSSGGRKDTRCW